MRDSVVEPSSTKQKTHIHTATRGYLEKVLEALLDTKKAGAYLDTPPKTLVTWRCTGRVKLPYVKIGGNVRYRLSDLDAFIEANLHDVNPSNGGA